MDRLDCCKEVLLLWAASELRSAEREPKFKYLTWTGWDLNPEPLAREEKKPMISLLLTSFPLENVRKRVEGETQFLLLQSKRSSVDLPARDLEILVESLNKLFRMLVTMDIKTAIKLNNGSKIPILGLGTWELTGKNAEQSVLWALEAGYRHIDTASIYGNEKEVGSAIKKSKVPRKEIFVTTKLWNSDHKNPEKALESSLQKLGLDYVDLYLIHWPAKQRNETWKKLEQFLKDGKCKSIGVSNFTIKHLTELMKTAKIVPAVNQVEFSPFLYQKELLEFCKSKGISLEAYSPLTRGRKLGDLELAAVATKNKKSPAQIILRWALQKDIVVIPKSKSKERIVENTDIFDFKISEEDMKALDELNEDYRTCWNPDEID